MISLLKTMYSDIFYNKCKLKVTRVGEGGAFPQISSLPYINSIGQLKDR